MATLIGTIVCNDNNGQGYSLRGDVYLESQNTATRTSYVSISAYKYANGGKFDLDVRGWNVTVAAVSTATGSGSASGSAAPNFDGFVAGQTASLGSSGLIAIVHKTDGTAQITASGSWAATSSGGWFDTGFSGSAGPWTLPTIIAAPAAPTSVVATRASDSQVTLAWVRNVTANRPYTSQELFRKINNGALTDTAPISGASTSTSYATAANRKHTFVIEARNAAGSAQSVESNVVLTTPAPFGSLAGAVVGAGIKLTFPAWPAGYAEAEVPVQITTDGGGAWTAVTTLPYGTFSTSTATDWTDTSAPSSGVVQYRARLSTTGGTQGTLTSDWVVSNVLALNTPPNAPTGLIPSGVVDATHLVRLMWTHNASSDGALQSSRKIEYTTDGGGSSVSIVSGDDTLGYYDWSITLGSFTPGQTIQWRVATAGSEPGVYGAWSAWQTITLWGALAVTVTSPDDFWEGGPMPIVWSTTVPWGTASQVSYRVVLAKISGEVSFDSGTVTSSDVSMFIPAEFQQNLTDYAVTVTLIDNHGLPVSGNALTETDYFEPGQLMLTFAYSDDTATMTFTPTFSQETSSTFDDTASWQLQRSFDGGQSYVSVGSTVGQVPLSDSHVRIGTASLYRGIPVSVLGVAGVPTVITITPQDVESRWAWINYGPTFDTICRFGWNLNISVESSRASDSYAVEGRQWPVAVFGEPRSRVRKITGTLLYKSSIESLSSSLPDSYASSTPDEFRDAAEQADVCLYRSPAGEWAYARLTDFSVQPQRVITGQPDKASVSFQIEKIDTIGSAS